MPRKPAPFRRNPKDRTYTAVRDLTPEDIVSKARSLLRERYRRYQALSGAEDTKAFLVLQLGDFEQEVFACVFLDSQHRVIAFEKLFYGTIDGASVHPRELVKKALSHNAAAVILAHNHPSGVPEPSHADQALTSRLKDALSLIDVRVLDHIIVAGDDSMSFTERGML